tara:strand:+ start:921 stop:1304 length:384 start_codon:yes stop_codon:yes gene_type:complete
MKLPHLRLESDRVAHAATNAFVIRTNPLYKNNVGLYMHEYEHVKQFYFAWLMGSAVVCFIYMPALPVAFGTHSLLYLTVKKYRKWCEVKAYRKQIKVNGYGTDFYAKALANDYNLGISFIEAKKLLS